MTDNFDVGKWMKNQLLKEDEDKFEAEQKLEKTLKNEFPEVEDYNPVANIYPGGAKITFKSTQNVNKHLFDNVVNFLKKIGFTVKKENNFFDEDSDRGKMYPYIELAK